MYREVDKHLQSGLKLTYAECTLYNKLKLYNKDKL